LIKKKYLFTGSILWNWGYSSIILDEKLVEAHTGKMARFLLAKKLCEISTGKTIKKPKEVPLGIYRQVNKLKMIQR